MNNPRRLDMQDQDSSTEALRHYLQTVYGDDTGVLIGKTRRQFKYTYPDLADRAIAAMLRAAKRTDVWLCPYLMRDEHRLAGNAVSRRLVHADVDTETDIEKVRAIGGFAVGSGTAGHAHVYVPLSATLSHEQHTALCKGLIAYLGGDTGKHHDNDLLRPPGTLNYKTDPPLPVRWLIEPDGSSVEPGMLARLLGVDLDRRPEPKPVTNGQLRAPDATNHRYVNAAIADEFAKVSNSVAGVNRNTNLFVAAKTLGMFPSIDRGRLRADLSALARPTGLPDSEIDKTIRQGFDAADKAGPRAIPEPTTNRDTMTEANSSESAGRRTTRETHPAADDLADYTPSELLDKLSVTGDWLNKQEFDELEYVVPQLICEGLGMLVAPPKKGKSFLVGNLAVAVASGGKALGCLPVKQRPVLVLALEDGYRRIRDRYTNINEGQPIPGNITFVTKATPAECTVVIAEYLRQHQADKPLVILDTLGKVKRARHSGEESFQVDYALGTQFKNLADSAPGATILVIHHTRKAEAADFIDLVSGTQGLAASVDYLLALDRKRHHNEAILSVTGRDIIEAEYALVADDGYLWRLDGATLSAAADRADQIREQATESARLARLSKRSREIVQFVDWRGRVTAGHVAVKFDLTPKRASEQLKRLAEGDYIVKQSRGEYVSKRLAGLADCAEYTDYADDAESEGASPPGDTAQSAQSALSTDTAYSAPSSNTCDCGASLTQQTSRERGVCSECWSKGRRKDDDE